MRLALLLALAACAVPTGAPAGCTLGDGTTYPCGANVAFIDRRGVAHECGEGCEPGERCAVGVDGQLVVGYCASTPDVRPILSRE